mgnify:CR=1 FL=1
MVPEGTLYTLSNGGRKPATAYFVLQAPPERRAEIAQSWIAHLQPVVLPRAPPVTVKLKTGNGERL